MAQVGSIARLILAMIGNESAVDLTIQYVNENFLRRLCSDLEIVEIAVAVPSHATAAGPETGGGIAYGAQPTPGLLTNTYDDE